MGIRGSLTDREYHKFKELSDNSTAVQIINASNLIPDEYDYIELSYTGEDLTGVIYKKGGSSGTTIATLTLSYTAGKLTSVERT